MHKSVIKFYGGAGYVTGANFVLESSGIKLMLDCGLIQGGKFASFKNSEKFPYNPKDIDFLFVSHAHMDHIGRIPKLVKEGFSGKIYSTHATKELAPLMFYDALNIMRAESKIYGYEPIYDETDIEKTMSMWNSLEYGEQVIINNLSIKFKNAGHILGSAMIFIDNANSGKRFIYTGDLGNEPEPLLPSRDKIENANYLLIESVYGDRTHEDKSKRLQILKNVLTEAEKYKKTVLIPSFSLERTQILLYEINNLVESGEIKSIPIYLDSPLAIKITELFKKYKYLFNKKVKDQINRGDDIFDFPNFHYVKDKNESVSLLNLPAPKVIIAGSGMSTGGRVLMHEKKILEDPNAIILFVGYQAPGSLGRQIQDGNKFVNIEGKKVKVRAKKMSIKGYSAHADQDALLNAISESQESLEQVFIALGELKSSLFLAQRVHDYLGLDVHVPEIGEELEINF